MYMEENPNQQMKDDKMSDNHENNFNDRFISIDDVIAALENYPEAQMLVKVVRPYIPLIMREGTHVYMDFIRYATQGQWVELDRAMWEKMTEDERDKLSEQILLDARRVVDNQYRRNKLAKEIGVKITTSLLLALL